MLQKISFGNFKPYPKVTKVYIKIISDSDPEYNEKFCSATSSKKQVCDCCKKFHKLMIELTAINMKGWNITVPYTW